MLPSWLVSVALHTLLCTGLFLIQFERSGIPEGSGRGLGQRAIQIDATFGTGRAAGGGKSPANFTTEIDVPTEVDIPAPPGNAEAPETQEMPAEAVAERSTTDTSHEVVDTAADGTPFEPLSPAEPENEVAIIPRSVPPSTKVAAQVASVTGPANGTRPGTGRAMSGVGPDGGGDGAGEGEGDGAGDGPGDGSADGGAGDGRAERFGNPDGTSFFQVVAQGKHFCYVVDCSSSMEEDNVIDIVRNELRSSLRKLDPAKRFQLLFYDAEIHPLTADGKTVFSVSEANRKLAWQFIRSQRPTGRALHLPALMSALRSKPDIIFFLTDGEVPELSARDLYELKSSNHSRTRIHVIEFGKGAKLESNWLEKLARDHRGNYRYQDIESTVNGE